MSSPLEPNISRQNPEKRNKNIFMDDFIEQSEEARTNNAMQPSVLLPPVPVVLIPFQHVRLWICHHYQGLTLLQGNLNAEHKCLNNSLTVTEVMDVLTDEFDVICRLMHLDTSAKGCSSFGADAVGYITANDFLLKKVQTLISICDVPVFTSAAFNKSWPAVVQHRPCRGKRGKYEEMPQFEEKERVCDSSPDLQTRARISAVSPSTHPQRQPPPHLLLSSSPHLLISFSPRLLISSSPPLLVSSSPHLLITSSPRLLVSSSPHLLLSSSPRLLISSSPRLLVSSSPHLLVSSSPRLLISSSPHLFIHLRSQQLPLNFSSEFKRARGLFYHLGVAVAKSLCAQFGCCCCCSG
ncbi:hypothetical protein F2P81_012273 [Scophthalmus maximus]|uniref:Uncharacterized protein n=1 Tax=Scophthalmus maximus TaxID=52904 RepID=A0A6A4SPJ3_SCOMX|nr:hypothetical protein F2P81_012273 [Scophthalmus maximus]